jgi:hypothetical protein
MMRMMMVVVEWKSKNMVYFQWKWHLEKCKYDKLKDYNNDNPYVQDYNLEKHI